MTVFVIVTPAVRAISLPFTVVVTAVGGVPPVVDTVIEASANMVPTIVDPVPIVAPAGTYQNTFLGWAPLMSRTWIGTAGVAGPGRPTLSVPVPAPVWNTHTAFASPPASRVRLAVVRAAPPMSYVPVVDLYTPGGRVRPAYSSGPPPAPPQLGHCARLATSIPPGRFAGDMELNATNASARACVTAAAATEPGGAVSVYTSPVTKPSLFVVTV